MTPIGTGGVTAPGRICYGWCMWLNMSPASSCPSSDSGPFLIPCGHLLCAEQSCGPAGPASTEDAQGSPKAGTPPPGQGQALLTWQEVEASPGCAAGSCQVETPEERPASLPSSVCRPASTCCVSCWF